MENKVNTFHPRSWLWLVLVATAVGGLLIGFIIGGYISRDVQARSFLAADQCQDNCLAPNQLMGLIGSVVMQRNPNLLPLKVKETDKTVVIQYPLVGRQVHYVAIPKKDIKHAGEITAEDAAYFIDTYAVLGEIVREENIQDYRIITNGPGYQSVAYLHFHLLGRKER